jgi:hypothetical protein
MELLSCTGTEPDLLERRRQVEEQVAERLDHPFEPHRIARLRLVAYQKAVVIRYLDILLEWGDLLFRRDTIESITEATQLHLLAVGILGERPQRVPARSTVAPRTYAELRKDLNDFSNAAVVVENEVVFPFATTPAASGSDAASEVIWSRPAHPRVVREEQLDASAVIRAAGDLRTRMSSPWQAVGRPEVEGWRQSG